MNRFPKSHKLAQHRRCDGIVLWQLPGRCCTRAGGGPQPGLIAFFSWRCSIRHCRLHSIISVSVFTTKTSLLTCPFFVRTAMSQEPGNGGGCRSSAMRLGCGGHGFGLCSHAWDRAHGQAAGASGNGCTCVLGLVYMHTHMRRTILRSLKSALAI